MKIINKLASLNIMITARGYSIDKASSILGISRSYLNNILNDKRKVSEETLKVYVSKLGFTYDDYQLLQHIKSNLDTRNDMDFSDKYQRLLLVAVASYFVNYVPDDNSNKQKTNVYKKTV